MSAVRVCVLGDALARGSRRDTATGQFTTPTHPSFRPYLATLLEQRGVEFDYVGSQTYPDFPVGLFPGDQDNEAHGGNTTLGHIASNVAAWVAGYIPDVVLLLAGREDAYAQTLVADRIAALTTIIQRLRERNPAVAVLVGTVPPTLDGSNGAYRTEKQIRPYNEALPGWVVGTTSFTSPVVLVDLHTGFSQDYVLSDGRELSDLGDRWIAGRWIGVLVDLLPGTPGGGGEPTPGAVVPQVTATPTTGIAPLEVTFIDRSVVDQWTRRMTVLSIDVDLGFVRECLKFVPSVWSFPEVRMATPEEWALQTTDGDTYPWPRDPYVLLVHRPNPAAFKRTSYGRGSGTPKASVVFTDPDYPEHRYSNLGQLIEHELYHTVPGLESPDHLRTSEGFRAWLLASDPDHPFLLNPQGTPISNALLALYYRYLLERLKTTPEFTNGQVAFDLDFGDGEPHSSEPDCEHVYADPGTYSPVLTVTDATGRSATTTFHGLIVVSGEEEPPTAVFSANRTGGVAPVDVQFSYTGIGATAWLWDFGDGSPTSTLRDPVHVYTAPGVYSPRLTATNASGTTSVLAPGLITVVSNVSLPPSIHMITPAGVANLYEYVSTAWTYIQLYDPSGASLGTRAGVYEAWSRDELDQIWVAFSLAARDVAAPLPATVAGFEVWTAQTGGTRVCRIPFDGELPEFRRLNDSVSVKIAVGLAGTTQVCRITDLEVGGSDLVGNVATISLLLFGGTGTYRIDGATISPSVQDGADALIGLTFTRVG